MLSERDSKKRFTTKPLSRERSFEISYRSIKPKKLNRSSTWFIVDHHKMSKILPLDVGSVRYLFWVCFQKSFKQNFLSEKGQRIRRMSATCIYIVLSSLRRRFCRCLKQYGWGEDDSISQPKALAVIHVYVCHNTPSV